MAQLDSASDSDSEGRKFESCRAGQKFDKPKLVEFFIYHKIVKATGMISFFAQASAAFLLKRLSDSFDLYNIRITRRAVRNSAGDNYAIALLQGHTRFCELSGSIEQYVKRIEHLAHHRRNAP